jgi:hypothetical protein
MERDNRNFSRGYRDDSHRSDHRNNRRNNEDFENYRDRYSSGGNYYGMQDENAEYRNVRSTGNTNFGSGPVGGYGASSHRGARNEDQNQYHYGDPNPYMGNDRNGGYDRTRGTGWRDNNDRNYRGDSRTSDRERYSRQDNSYQYGGEGRRYSDFGRDEGRTYNRDTNRGYNMGTEDSYYDRGSFGYDRSVNDYRGGKRDQDADYDHKSDDFRYSGRIQNAGSDRDDNYATGLYASNRAYNSEQQSNSDGERTSSRHKRYDRSGPNYSASSSASDYGAGEFRG